MKYQKENKKRKDLKKEIFPSTCTPDCQHKNWFQCKRERIEINSYKTTPREVVPDTPGEKEGKI